MTDYHIGIIPAKAATSLPDEVIFYLDTKRKVAGDNDTTISIFKEEILWLNSRG
jgi:hypothetical protein